MLRVFFYFLAGNDMRPLLRGVRSLNQSFKVDGSILMRPVRHAMAFSPVHQSPPSEQ